MQNKAINVILNDNPFPGLRAFKDSESHLFFGREEHITDVLRKLDTNHFVAVVGTSGTGKSSLIKAGVLPAISERAASKDAPKWEVISMNPGSDPIVNLANAICKNPSLVGKEGEEGFKSKLVDLMNHSTLGLVQAMRPVLDSNSRLLILVDQFEEVFRFAGEDELDAKAIYDQFVKLLIETIKQRDVPIYAILTLRSDFLGDCVAFEGLPEAINDGHYLVPRMNNNQMKRAITGPIDYAEGKISPRLIQHIANDLGANPDQLPILQHAMMRCWDYWKKNEMAGQPMDLKHFEAIGDLDKALSTHADEAFDELDVKEQVLAEKIFKCLTTKKADNRGVRRPMSLGNLIKITQSTQDDVVRCLAPFQKVGRSFVLPGTEIEPTESTIYDISHESLMRGWDRLKNWVDEEMDSAEFYDRICIAASLYKKGAAALWRNPELQLAIDWHEKQNPIKAWGELYNEDFDLGVDFIVASRQADILENSSKTRRTRIIRFSVTSFVVVISMLAAWALFQTNIANNKTEEAEVKSQEAIEQKKVAEVAKEEAQSASNEAEASKLVAEEQAKIAEEQAKLAESQKRIAESERSKSEVSARVAVSKQQLADQKSKEAIEQRYMADAASAEANRLRMVATSQNLAYSSAQVTQNTELAALLAIESYSLAKANGGITNSASLYNAASKALRQMAPDYSPKIVSTEKEVIALSAKNNVLSVIDRFSNYQMYSGDDYSILSTRNGELAEIDINTAYINPLKNEAVYGLNSFAIEVVDTDNSKTLLGHTGLVRAVAFRSSDPTMISGGRDAKLILWNNDGSKDQIQLEARVKAISTLPNIQVAYVGCENGVVYRVGINDKSLSVFASKSSGRVEAIAQTEQGGTIAIGYSDGITRVYSAKGRLLKEFLGMGSVVAAQMNKANDVLAVAYSGRLIRLYSITDLTKLPIEIKTERPITALDFNADSQEIFIYATDRTIQKYPIGVDWYIEQLQGKVNRQLSEEEWKTFVGSDIPFNATQTNTSE